MCSHLHPVEEVSAVFFVFDDDVWSYSSVACNSTDHLGYQLLLFKGLGAMFLLFSVINSLLTTVCIVLYY